jgi:hypothetical protein
MTVLRYIIVVKPVGDFPNITLDVTTDADVKL